MLSIVRNSLALPLIAVGICAIASQDTAWHPPALLPGSQLIDFDHAHWDTYLSTETFGQKVRIFESRDDRAFHLYLTGIKVPADTNTKNLAGAGKQICADLVNLYTQLSHQNRQTPPLSKIDATLKPLPAGFNFPGCLLETQFGSQITRQAVFLTAASHSPGSQPVLHYLTWTGKPKEALEAGTKLNTFAQSLVAR